MSTEKLEKRKQAIDDMFAKIEVGVKEVFESETYKNYLRTMSKFHQYSFRNSLLIELQKPDATVVAGYGSWKTKFKRQVRKGEKGIQILGYSPRKITQEQELKDPNGKIVYDKNGDSKKEKITKEIPSFTPVYVFDVSQTEGEPLPTLVNELDGSIENYNNLFEALKEVSPFPIEFENIQSGAKGYCDPKNKRIAIKEGMSEVQTIKTLIHEITHADLHASEFEKGAVIQTDTRTREVEAESTAFVVASHYDIDTSEYSFGYLAGWSSSRELDELQNSLETIQKQANDLIDRIDSRLEELQLVKESSVDLAANDTRLKAKEPTVLIEWSENANFKENEVDTLFNINSRLKAIDTQLKDDLGYDKTKYTLSYYLDGEEHQYTGRVDLGDGLGGIVENIKSYWTYEMNTPIFHKTAEEMEAVKYMVNEFVPYLENHLAISELEEKYKNQDILKLIESEYINKISEWVEEARKSNNNGSELPKLPERIDKIDIQEVPKVETLTERPAKSDIKRTFVIYQLSHTEENRDIVFENFGRLEKQGLKPEYSSYEKIYKAEMPSNTNLEDIFVEFNINLPGDYTGRSLSVSDIVVIDTDKESNAYFVDSFGFKEIPEFAQQHNKGIVKEKSAREYGSEAFKKGLPCMPAMDQDFLNNKIAGLKVGHGATELMKNWNKGWTDENLRNNSDLTRINNEPTIFRYYSTQRPVSPGTYPKNNNVVEIFNYDKKTNIEGTVTWGYIDYKQPLSQELAISYELKPDKTTARRIREMLDNIVFDGEIDLDKVSEPNGFNQNKTPMSEKFNAAKEAAASRNEQDQNNKITPLKVKDQVL